MKTRKLALCAALGAFTSLLPACGLQSYVETDDAALGRVVVYRNGVAYYERRATLEGDKLALSVPGDKVDDFLKSLTVADARTGQPLPVSFPGGGGSGDGSVDMTVSLPPAPGGDRQVVLTYVTEAPAWKPSYRVSVNDQGKVNLEGWAVVDNTSGEDWNAVRVGVGSSSALAFRYDLKSVRTVHRDILQTEERFAVAPPTGGSLYRTESTPHVIEELAADDLPSDRDEASGTEADVLDGAVAAAAGPPAAGPMKTKAPAAPPPPAREAKESKVRALAESLRRRGENLVIEGYAEAGEADPEARALERAHALRNQLIKEGVAPAQVQVQSRGVVAGKKAGVRLVAEPAPANAAAANSPAPDAEPVGESHFESQTPMTVARGTSAMVSILKSDADGEIVYLFDPESERGDGRFAFRSVLFRNPTGSTLETGPVTVYGQTRFIGEGLTEAIPPHATAVVPFALDRQVVVERQSDGQDRIARLTTLQRGVLTCEVQHHRTTKLTVTNRQSTASTVLVRHSTGRGWAVAKAPADSEQYGQSRLYRIKLNGGETKVVEIEETTPMTRTIDLRAPDGLAMVEAFLQAPDRPAQFADQMERLLKLHREMANTEQAITSLRERGEEFRTRMDELHGQIVSLGLTRTGGTLSGHLQAKMKQMSEKVQQNTLAVVNQQEKLMLARVAFQDAIAELTLAPAAANAPIAAAP